MNGSLSSLRAAALACAAAAAWAGLGLGAAGCASTARVTAPPAASGAYAGADAAGVTVRLELTSFGEVRAGRGEIGGRPLAVAAIGGGAAVLAGGGPGLVVGRLEQAGESVTLEAPLLQGIATLKPAGDTVPGGGRFAGRFRDFDGRLELDLDQWGGAVAGRGSLGGRPVALAATVAPGAEGTARGGLLLADGSAVEIELDFSGGWLTLDGLAGRRELRRVE